MTPEQIAEEIALDWGMTMETRRDIEARIRATINDKLEAAAVACDAIADDKHALYKGHSPHAPDNAHRADAYTEGESSGAGLCADAIRAMKGQS